MVNVNFEVFQLPPASIGSNFDRAIWKLHEMQN